MRVGEKRQLCQRQYLSVVVLQLVAGFGAKGGNIGLFCVRQLFANSDISASITALRLVAGLGAKETEM